MSTATMVRVSISPEARCFVEREGQLEQFGTMIDRARRRVPGLRSIEVTLDEASEEIPSGVVLWVHRDHVETEVDSTHQEWVDWMVATFPPEVCQNYALLSIYHDDGR